MGWEWGTASRGRAIRRQATFVSYSYFFCVWVECSWGGPFGGDGFSPPRRIFWSQESNCLGFCRRPPWLGALTPFLDGNALGAPSQNTSEIPGRKRPWRSWHSRPGKFWPFPAGKGLAIPGRERSGHSRPGKVWAFQAGKGLGIPGRERSGRSRPGKVWAFPAGKDLGIPDRERSGHSQLGKRWPPITSLWKAIMTQRCSQWIQKVRVHQRVHQRLQVQQLFA